MVPGEIGILPEYREVTGTPRGVNGPTWAKREKEKGAAPLVQFGPEGGCAPPSFRPLSSIPVWPNKAHILPGEFP